ncbi:hypothetical protein [Pseudomonas sp. UMAB-40]|uniref:hypothetical protein n=1 Tax=Pseudomonas sp. UMAB-40 TaxID=1365407 RepID=UPI001C59F060|nr:hypothetical protein [Pseudomonas sp. UMAB-40]
MSTKLGAIHTSNFTAAFRREINARDRSGLTARVQVLNPKSERQFGADACIIFENRTEFKIAFFEAKWPRLKTQVNAWDSVQKSTGGSHFHSQLVRQHPHAGYAAIWEMFYCEYQFHEQPRSFPVFGSACVWHQDAYAASLSRGIVTQPWEDSDLLSLLCSSGTDIRNIISQICECHAGRPLPKDKFGYKFPDGAAPHEALVITYDGDSIHKNRLFD